MSDLISRQDAIEAIRKNVSKSETENSLCFNLGLGIAEHVVNSLTSAEPKTGEWVWSDEDASWMCGACCCVFEEIDWKPNYNFCPNCGARMLGEDGEE